MRLLSLDGSAPEQGGQDLYVLALDISNRANVFVTQIRCLDRHDIALKNRHHSLLPLSTTGLSNGAGLTLSMPAWWTPECLLCEERQPTGPQVCSRMLSMLLFFPVRCQFATALPCLLNHSLQITAGIAH